MLKISDCVKDFVTPCHSGLDPKSRCFNTVQQNPDFRRDLMTWFRMETSLMKHVTKKLEAKPQ